MSENKNNHQESLQEESCMIAIMQMIRNGEISPEERVGESSLSNLLGVGLAAVRGALKRLANIGIIRRVPRSGSYIRKFTISDFGQITDVRCALECLSIRLSTLSCTQEDLEILMKKAELADDSMKPTSGDKGYQIQITSYDQDRNFHEYLFSLSKNFWIQQILGKQNLLEFCFLIGLQFPPITTKDVPSHQEIVEVMATRDAIGAEQLMRKHILIHKEIRMRATYGDLF